MADFKNLTLTTLGSALLEKAIAGATLEFTKAAIGDGKILNGTDISQFTALVNEKKSIPINSMVYKDGLATVTIVFSNSDLSEGFYVRELGLFAKDPEKGEILYAIANAGDDVDWLPEMGSNVVEEVFKIVPVVSGATKVTAVIDSSLTYVTKETFEAHRHATNGQNDGKKVEAKDVVSTPSGLITATTVQGVTNQAGSIIAPSEADYILNTPSIGYGGKFTANNDLSVNISPFEAMIGRKYHKSGAVSNVTLKDRKASIIYAGKNNEDSSVSPALGHYDAVYPEADSNTVLRYVFNEASGEVVDSSPAGINHGIVKGTVTRQVDGWADYAMQGDGSTGYIVSSGYTEFPTGTAEREIDLVVTLMNTASGTLYSYGLNPANNAFGMMINSGVLQADYSYNDISTGYSIETGKTYFINHLYKDGICHIYINGILIYSGSVSINTGNGLLYIGQWLGAGSFGKAIYHYLEIRKKVRSSQQIAQISNKLCLPCHYIGYSGSYPDNDTTSGAHIYKFDDASGNTVTDENGMLNGTASGTSIVDSEIKLGKVRKFNGTSDYIDLGTQQMFSSGSANRTFIAVLNANSTGVIMGNGKSSSNDGAAWWIDGSQKLMLYNVSNSSGWNSNSTIPFGAPVFLATVVSGIVGSACQITHYVNSQFPDVTLQANIPVGAGALNPMAIGKETYNNTAFLNCKFEYLAVIPRTLSQTEITQYYKALMVQKERTLIDDCFPGNAISLGFARTGSSSLIEYNDIDYKYMRNEGAIKAEGNKRVFLGYKYFNTGGTSQIFIPFNIPFGINKYKLYAVYSTNLVDEIKVIEAHYNNVTSKFHGGYISYQDNNKCCVSIEAGGLIGISGAWQTSGYIGCYAEVL